MQDNSAQSPTDPNSQPQATQPVTSPISGRKFPGGKVIPTILGILLLLGGVGAGLILVEQQQDIREKASEPTCAWCAGPDQCFGSTGHAPESGPTTACGDVSNPNSTCCLGFNPGTAAPPPSTTPTGGTVGIGGNCTLGGPVECQSGLCGSCLCDPSSSSDAVPDGRQYICVASQDNTGCTQACNVKFYGGAPPPGETGQTTGATNYCDGNGCSWDTAISRGAQLANCGIFAYKCPNQFGLPCNQNSSYCDGSGCSKTFEANYCGTQQIDIRCPNTNTADTNDSIVLDYVSLIDQASCGGAPPPGDTTPPGEIYSCNSRCDTDAQCQQANSAYRCTQNVCVNPAYPGSPTCGPAAAGATAQCLNVRVYDEDGNDITLPLTTGAATLNPGDIISFGVRGTATSGAIDMARFTVGGTLLPETTTIRAGTTDEFISQYTVPTGVTTISVAGEIHHPTLGWF